MTVPGKLIIVLWRLSMVLVLGSALLLVGPQLAAPWIERHAEQLIEWMTPDGLTITLDELQLDWRNRGADVEVRGLRIEHEHGERPLLIADRFRARFDPMTSLSERRLAWDTVDLRAESLAIPEYALLEEPAVPGWIDWLQIERADVRIAELAIANGSDWPKASNLAGSFRLDRGRVELQLDSTDLVLEGVVSDRIIALDRLTGNLFWQAKDTDWELLASELRVENADLELVLHGGLRQLAGESHIDLTADFRIPEVGRIPAYLPSGLSPYLTDWLKQSLRAGRVTDGRLVLRGRAVDFPFESGPGEFLATMRTIDMTLAYHPDWPALEQLQAELRFHGYRLNIDATDGRLDGHRLLPSTAMIDDLRSARLQLGGELEGDLAGMRRTVLESPLREQLSGYLTSLRLEGPGELQLDLDIPFTGEEWKVGVDGVLSMEGASGVLDEPELVLESLHGVVGFSDSGLDEGRFDLRIAGEPVELWLRDNDALALQAELTGRWSNDDLRRTPLEPLADWLDGRSDWRVTLDVPRAAPGRYRLELTSDLAGSRVLLPGNLGKPAESVRPFRLQLDVDGERRDWTVDHGPVRDLRLQQGGDGRMQRVAGVLVDPVLAGHGPGSIRIHGQREGSSLQLMLAGERVQGQLAIPDRIDPEQPLWLALDRLNPRPAPDVANEAIDAIPMVPMNPRVLPPIMITVRALLWDDRELGQLTVRGEPMESGYRLSDGQLHHERHRLQLQGFWEVTETTEVTALQAELVSDSLGELLALFDLGGIEQAATGLRFGLRWPGSPVAMDRTALQGEFELRIEEGALTAIEPGLGRLLGLLNLASLQRRLQLNFDDVTDSGLAFDRITGRLSLQQGRLLSDDLEVAGPAARVVISGLLDLDQRSVDQVITVMPEIGMPLALASTLAGGPMVGAAVFFADQLLKNEFDRLLSYRYALTGDWDDPRIDLIRPGAPP